MKCPTCDFLSHLVYARVEEEFTRITKAVRRPARRRRVQLWHRRRWNVTGGCRGHMDVPPDLLRGQPFQQVRKERVCALDRVLRWALRAYLCRLLPATKRRHRRGHAERDSDQSEVPWRRRRADGPAEPVLRLHFVRRTQLVPPACRLVDDSERERLMERERGLSGPDPSVLRRWERRHVFERAVLLQR